MSTPVLAGYLEGSEPCFYTNATRNCTPNGNTTQTCPMFRYNATLGQGYCLKAEVELLKERLLPTLIVFYRATAPTT